MRMPGVDALKSMVTNRCALTASMLENAVFAFSSVRLPAAGDHAASISTMASGFLAITCSQLTVVQDPGELSKMFSAPTSRIISAGTPQHAPADGGSPLSYQNTRGGFVTAPILDCVAATSA